jgi:hypothetical protein
MKSHDELSALTTRSVAATIEGMKEHVTRLKALFLERHTSPAGPCNATYTLVLAYSLMMLALEPALKRPAGLLLKPSRRQQNYFFGLCHNFRLHVDIGHAA